MPNDSPRVLFTGQCWPGANTMYIANAFERCGATVQFLNDTGLVPDWKGTRGKIARRLLMPMIEREWNEQLLNLAGEFKPDLVYITNADLCRPKTVEAIRRQGVPVMCFYHDVPWKNVAGNRLPENLPHFDLVSTTRRWHEPEFREAGARDVMIVRFGYEPDVHRPLEVGSRAVERYGADISFIGSYRPRRAKALTALAESRKCGLRIWGGMWEQLPQDSILREHWQRRTVQETEIPVIYAASKIALHWLVFEPDGPDPAMRKGDQHNSRTFQIAACGGAMMVAQRTDEHRQFFKEDKEAVFFDDADELCDKLTYWLNPARDRAREEIARAARLRCIKEDYSYVPVVRRYLEHFGLLTTASRSVHNPIGAVVKSVDDVRPASRDGRTPGCG